MCSSLKWPDGCVSGGSVVLAGAKTRTHARQTKKTKIWPSQKLYKNFHLALGNLAKWMFWSILRQLSKIIVISTNICLALPLSEVP